MNLKKKFLTICNISFLLLLNNCVQSSTAFLGPIITVGKTGNVYHAGLSYTSNNLIEKQLGKKPTIYIKDFLEKNLNKNKKVNIVALKPINNTSIKNGNVKPKISSRNSEMDYKEFVNAVQKILK